MSELGTVASQGPETRDSGEGARLIGDESALFFHLHSDLPKVACHSVYQFDMSTACSAKAREFKPFNTAHPLYGGEPVCVLVPEARLRLANSGIEARLLSAPLPPGSVTQLRDGLYLARPGLVLARLASRLTETQLAEAGMNLCARYFLDVGTGEIEDRSRYLTTPAELRAYLEQANNVRGRAKAMRALRWVLQGSGSPMETKLKLQMCHPLWKGGFGLPFTEMNYDVSAGRLSQLAEQSYYCIDLVSLAHKVGLEYDGEQYHNDTGNDHRRRNALRAMGWEVFPVDKSILFNPEATEKLGYQVAKRMGIRLQKPRCWEEKYAELRRDLDLPV